MSVEQAILEAVRFLPDKQEEILSHANRLRERGRTVEASQEY